MTCFWDGIMSSLDDIDFNLLGFYKHTSIRNFITCLKQKNCKTNNVEWNGELLSEQLLTENMLAVENYNIDEISNGHLTSSCDYFLCLLCEILRIKIVHVFMNTVIVYSNIKQNTKTIKFGSTNSHFFQK